MLEQNLSLNRTIYRLLYHPLTGLIHQRLTHYISSLIIIRKDVPEYILLLTHCIPVWIPAHGSWFNLQPWCTRSVHHLLYVGLLLLIAFSNPLELWLHGRSGDSVCSNWQNLSSSARNSPPSIPGYKNRIKIKFKHWSCVHFFSDNIIVSMGA